MIAADTASENAAESSILNKDADSAIMEPPQSAVAHLSKPSCEVPAEGDGDQHLSETRNSPEGLVPEKAASESAAEAEVAGKVTDAPVAEATADGPESTTSEQDTQRSVFVCAVVFMVLKDCGAIGPHTDPKQGWEAPVERLVTQTMEGLSGFSATFCPDKKLIKKVCKAVLKDMRRTFSREQLKSVTLTQDPAVETAIVKSIQARIAELAPRHQKKKEYLRKFKSAMEILTFIATLTLALAVIAIVI